MRWVIKNPAPLDARMKKWGDYHFGRCLAKWLERSGQQVESHYYGQWGRRREADVTLVLRGRFPARVSGRGLKVMWIISHPEDVTLRECASYDLIFVASQRHARRLQSHLDVPVVPLLQCVDTEDFRPLTLKEDRPRADFVFVGNTREEKRECVLWAVESGLPLKVWGRGWERWIPDRFVLADYLDNQKLPGLYSAAKVTFNDHWPGMKRCGFVSNRIFDALACGLPVVSDHLDEIEELFPGLVLTCRDRREFDECVERLLLDYPAVLSRAGDAVQLVRQRHSFEKRVQTLLGSVRERLGR